MRSRVISQVNGSQASAFGLIKVAQEWTQIHLSFPYNLNTDLVLTEETSGGTVTQGDNFAILQTGTNAAGAAEMVSRDRLKYIPGQGVVCRFTRIFTAGVAGSSQYHGCGDDTDALTFGFDGATFGIMHRRDGITTWIPQSAWNGAAVVDGFDPTKLNVYQIDFQWLGGGAIRFGIENVANGAIEVVHTIRYAGTSIITTMHNPTLGMLAGVANAGNTTNLTGKTPSFGMAVEAPETAFALPGCFSNQKSGVGATEVPVFSIWNKDTFAGVANKVRIHARSMSFATTKDVQVRLIVRPTLTGGVPTWVDFSALTSPVATNTDRTGYTAGTGRPSFVAVGEVGSAHAIDIPPGAIHMNPGEILTVTAKSITGTAIVTAGLNWAEEF